MARWRRGGLALGQDRGETRGMVTMLFGQDGGKEMVAAAAPGMQSKWSKSADVWARAWWEEEADRWAARQELFQV
jgi:photosystem II stability/assembly factor-like uncharacterized protein